MEKPASLLELRGVRAGYGEAVVLDDVSLEVARNGSLAVLGRNGVGKSTLLLTVMGYTRLQAGSTVLPMLVIEGGWPSAGAAGIASSPDKQRRDATDDIERHANLRGER